MSVQENLDKHGVRLPPAPKPVGSYVPALRIGDLVMTSGQLPMLAGQLEATGKVPADTPLEKAQQAARTAVLNALAAAAGAAGGLEHIDRMVRLAVFVNSSPGFTEQPKVANAASDLLVQLFGDRGRHVRTAVGVAELPLDAAVELELTVAVRNE